MSATEPTGLDGSSKRRRLRILALKLRVHADAFRLAPLGYLQGVVWRLRRLKLRSSHRFAALLGRSPLAYPLWVLRDEARVMREAAAVSGPTPSIVVIIDCRSGIEGLHSTLESVAHSSLSPMLIAIGDPGDEADGHFQDWPSLRESDKKPAWVCLLRPGDRLAPNAFGYYASAIAAASDVSIIYADDDIIDGRGQRASPHFKPGWNAELFQYHDFLSGACLMRLDQESLRETPDGDWEGHLIRRLITGGAQPIHLPLILHHRRARPAPMTAPASPRAGPQPPVTVIIPTRNRCDLLRICLEGLSRTTYPALDVVIIDNGSDDPATLAFLHDCEVDMMKVLRLPGPFNFSALNNIAARDADGDLLCFLNNDVEMESADWLRMLVGQAVRSDAGAVGAKLLYPDRTVQHAGVVIGIGGGAGHAHRFQGEFDEGYFHRADLPQRVSAVTAACMVVDRAKFLAVGGFDEENFPVAFNDVDLCLKLNARNWHCIYEPRAVLIHHESKSRGKDSARGNRSRFAGELAALKRIWGTDVRTDPYHHPQLSRFSEQFVVTL